MKITGKRTKSPMLRLVISIALKAIVIVLLSYWLLSSYKIVLGTKTILNGGEIPMFVEKGSADEEKMAAIRIDLKTTENIYHYVSPFEKGTILVFFETENKIYFRKHAATDWIQILDMCMDDGKLTYPMLDPLTSMEIPCRTASPLPIWVFVILCLIVVLIPSSVPKWLRRGAFETEEFFEEEPAAKVEPVIIKIKGKK